MAATVLLFGFNLYRTVTHQNGILIDFALYSKIIEYMKMSGTITTPHFIYPLLVLVASEIFPGRTYTVLGACIVLLFQLLLAHVLWRFWKHVLLNRWSDFVTVVLTLMCMTIAPVNLLTLSEQNGYFGYIGITIYHNPPILLCRPIALLNFIVFAAAVANQKISTRQIILCFITMALATLMKPNYALIIIPTAIIFASMAIGQKDFRLLRFISLGTLLPGFLILAGQFLFTYISPTSYMEQSHIIFAPFLVYERMSDYLFPKFILSVLFPLSVLVVFWKQVIRDRYYMIGLLLFIVGAVQSYFLAESGVRMYYGNFIWSAQLGLFLWFIVSMRVVLQRLLSDSNFARWSPALIAVYLCFALHVASGIVWYVDETIGPGSFW